MFHKRLLKEFPENRIYVVGMVFSQWISLLANAVLLFKLADVVGKILQEKMQEKDIYQMLLLLFVIVLLRAVAQSWNSKLSYKASSTVKSSLRERIYKKVMELGNTYKQTAPTSEIVQISTEGVEQLEIYFGKYVPQFFYSLLAPITLFLLVQTISMKVALVLLLCVPLIPISIVAVQKFAKKLLAKYWGAYTELGDSFLENLQGLTTLKIYQADERYAKKMDEEAEKFRKVTMRVLIMQLNSISVMDLVAYGGAAIGIVLSILELSAGHMSFSESLFIIMISAEFFLPLRLLGSFFHIAMNGNAAADKIFRLLDAPVSEQKCETEIPDGEITLEQVDFSYEKEKQVLQHVSMKIPKNSFVALAGTSGCGKSTIASLLMGDYTIAEAQRIKIGEIPLKEIERSALLKKMTRVRHDSYLFAGTVKDNLKMGNSAAGIREMEEALRQVDLYDTVKEKGGLDMEITEKAANLSGGQKQRLALARALLHDSDIYIFDEATSNIDVESENKIMEVIRNLAHKKTVILISHRLANVILADHIFMLKDGKIVEEGTHSQLMEKKQAYYNMFLAQQELEQFADESAVALQMAGKEFG